MALLPVMGVQLGATPKWTRVLAAAVPAAKAHKVPSTLTRPQRSLPTVWPELSISASALITPDFPILPRARQTEPYVDQNPLASLVHYFAQDRLRSPLMQIE
jgi:hypothetical protein